MNVEKKMKRNMNLVDIYTVVKIVKVAMKWNKMINLLKMEMRSTL